MILLPLFLVLGQSLVPIGGTELVHLEVLGDLLRSGRDLVNHVALILVLSMGDLVLFWILYQWRVAPRWLSMDRCLPCVSSQEDSTRVRWIQGLRNTNDRDERGLHESVEAEMLGTNPSVGPNPGLPVFAINLTPHPAELEDRIARLRALRVLRGAAQLQLEISSNAALP